MYLLRVTGWALLYIMALFLLNADESLTLILAIFAPIIGVGFEHIFQKRA